LRVFLCGLGGSELLAGCGNNKVMLYDIERKRLVGAASAHRDDINSVCYADAVYQPNVIVSASDDSFVKVCFPVTCVDLHKLYAFASSGVLF
jgi:WD40 repeat protein